MGAMLENRPAQQNGLEKQVVPKVVPRIIPFGSDFIHTNFRRGRDPDFTYTNCGGDVDENGYLGDL